MLSALNCEGNISNTLIFTTGEALQCQLFCHSYLPLVQVSFVTQEPPRRLKPSLHLRQFPPEPSQAEQWSSHLWTETLPWSEPPLPTRPRPSKMGCQPQKHVCQHRDIQTESEDVENSESEASKVTKTLGKMGLVVPA